MWQKIGEKAKRWSTFPCLEKEETLRKRYLQEWEIFYIIGKSHLAGFEDPQKLLKFQHFDIFLKQDSTCWWCFLWWPVWYCGADYYLWWLQCLSSFATQNLLSVCAIGGAFICAVFHSSSPHTHFDKVSLFSILQICSYYQNRFLTFPFVKLITNRFILFII